MMVFILNDFRQKYSEMKIIKLFTNKRLYYMGFMGYRYACNIFQHSNLANACTHIVKLIIELFCDSDLQFFVLSIMPNRRRYLYQHKWAIMFGKMAQLEKNVHWMKNFIVSNIDMERFSVCSLGNSGSSGSTMSSVWLINDDSYGWRLSAISSSRLEIPNVPYCFDSHDLQKFN